jgi:hypothetical protein
LVGLRGLEPAAFSRLVDVPFQGERLKVIGHEDFIAMKLFAHGPQDLVDADVALAAAGGDLDVPCSNGSRRAMAPIPPPRRR